MGRTHCHTMTQVRGHPTFARSPNCTSFLPASSHTRSHAHACSCPLRMHTCGNFSLLRFMTLHAMSHFPGAAPTLRQHSRTLKNGCPLQCVAAATRRTREQLRAPHRQRARSCSAHACVPVQHRVLHRGRIELSGVRASGASEQPRAITPCVRVEPCSMVHTFTDKDVRRLLSPFDSAFTAFA